MIKSLNIKNFKTLEDISTNLKELNLLTGLNGTGKSSFMQVLLLLRQSVLDSSLVPGFIQLNNSLVKIGRGKDALYQYAKDENIEFQLEYEDINFAWNLLSKTNYDILSPIVENVDYHNDYKILKEKSLFNSAFQYLNAEHIGPQLEYGTSEYAIRNNQIGVRGEYTIHFLNTYGIRQNIHFDNLHHPEANSRKLLHEVNAWLGEISPNIKLNITEIPSSEKLIAGYQYETKDDLTMAFTPLNIGFGISYVLPVITALLSATKDKLLIIENPEAHLHPRGQSRIGYLLALVAQNGVQIILETHSDHILNGIRVAAKKKEIDADKINILYFERQIEERNHRSIIHSPIVDNNGRIDNWPKGFFDEWDNMLDELIM